MMSLRFRLATLAFLLAAPAWAVDTPSQPESPPALDQARAAIDAGDYAGAIALLEPLSTEGDADVLNLLGYASRKSGDLEAAGRWYQAALEIDPDHLGALEYQGELFIELGDIAAAEANLARLAEACGACEEHADLAQALQDAGS